MGIFNLFGKKPKHYFFPVVGYSHECKYKKNGFIERLDALRQTLPGDAVTLKKYTYRGLPAFAVISDKLKCDIGVIRQADVKTMLQLLESNEQIVGTVSKVYSVYGKQESEDETDSFGSDLIEFTACDIAIRERR